MSAFVVMAGWAVGGRLGWWAMDKWLNARAAKRAEKMLNVTPKE